MAGSSLPEDEPTDEVGGAVDDMATLGALLGDTYRGELDRETTWRSRLDQTTTWSVTVMAAILTWAFSSGDNPHYIILIGVLAVGTFLSIEARRYRDYDVYRARVRLIQGNLLANTLNPETGVEHENWRAKLSEDYQRPTLKVTTFEALSNRLRRIYLPLLTVLVLAWVFRITAFVPAEEWLTTASIAAVPGWIIVGMLAVCYSGAVAIAYWPRDREAMGEFREGETGEWKTNE
ncbi:DUF2270 domain-containing protein [Saliphagus infecundisoli]|uniref:DUF2270 domain-containing protein n=1 Tax=Saliphagus infecundisoli TaxID=1849069 RepID=A0ABD5Q942_9EURY|nr:DUF2270 domain-containing protein [Saliphagus infecundisoli]